RPGLWARGGRPEHRAAQNRRFGAACATAGVRLDAAFEPGDHTWEFWDGHLPAVLAWMLKR
ncbi:esterase family protein, partial [Actinoplanes philippinensis]